MDATFGFMTAVAFVLAFTAPKGIGAITWFVLGFTCALVAVELTL